MDPDLLVGLQQMTDPLEYDSTPKTQIGIPNGSTLEKGNEFGMLYGFLAQGFCPWALIRLAVDYLVSLPVGIPKIFYL